MPGRTCTIEKDAAKQCWGVSRHKGGDFPAAEHAPRKLADTAVNRAHAASKVKLILPLRLLSMPTTALVRRLDSLLSMPTGAREAICIDDAGVLPVVAVELVRRLDTGQLDQDQRPARAARRRRPHAVVRAVPYGTRADHR